MKNALEKILQRISGAFAALKPVGEMTEINLRRIRESRIPESERLSDGIRKNALFPAGKSIAIKAKEREVMIFAVYEKKAVLKNMPQTGIAGIDVYDESTSEYSGTAAPDGSLCMTASLTFEAEAGRRYVLYMPPYAVLKKLYITGAVPVERTAEKKVAFYGSSVTQGCAASRPGLSYPNVLCRKIGAECLNFGFSESARGEGEVVERAAASEPDCVVVEYDHNSSLEELSERHENVYRTIRRRCRTCLIVLMSRFSYDMSVSASEAEKRRDVVRNTYKKAVGEGDERIVFIDGIEIMKSNRRAFFTDDRHPNDMGHAEIARVIENKMKEAESRHDSRFTQETRSRKS